MQIAKIGITILFSSLFIAGCTNTPPPAVSNIANALPRNNTAIPTATIDELASGRKVYEQNCAVCHKADGSGGKIVIEDKSLDPDDLTSAKIKSFSDEKIIKYILNGIPDEGMPAFKDKLSEGEIRDVVKLIRTQFHNQ